MLSIAADTVTFCCWGLVEGLKVLVLSIIACSYSSSSGIIVETNTPPLFLRPIRCNIVQAACKLHKKIAQSCQVFISVTFVESMTKIYEQLLLGVFLRVFAGRLVIALDRGIVYLIRTLTHKRQFSGEHWLKISPHFELCLHFISEFFRAF